MKKTVFLSLILAFSGAVMAQISPAQIDKLVGRTLKTFEVPGIAVAIVKDGKIIHAKGYGVKSI